MREIGRRHKIKVRKAVKRQKARARRDIKRKVGIISEEKDVTENEIEKQQIDRKRMLVKIFYEKRGSKMKAKTGRQRKIERERRKKRQVRYMQKQKDTQERDRMRNRELRY